MFLPDEDNDLIASQTVVPQQSAQETISVSSGGSGRSTPVQSNVETPPPARAQPPPRPAAPPKRPPPPASSAKTSTGVVESSAGPTTNNQESPPNPAIMQQPSWGDGVNVGTTAPDPLTRPYSVRNLSYQFLS